MRQNEFGNQTSVGIHMICTIVDTVSYDSISVTCHEDEQRGPAQGEAERAAELLGSCQVLLCLLLALRRTGGFISPLSAFTMPRGR